MSRIRAAVSYTAGHPLKVEEVVLRPPVGQEVEVAVKAVAICHSDISYIDGIWNAPLPAVWGHEAAGRITALGPGVRGLTVGQTVVVTLVYACGSCPSCGAGHPTACASPPQTPPALTRTDGGALTRGMNCGAFAEKVVVDQSQVVDLPDDIPMDAASLLACGVVTGIGAVVNSAGLRPGQDAVVIGAGGVGLNTIQGARIAGARRIAAVDITGDKLADARAFGATDTVLATEPRPWAIARAATGRGADAVFVTTGAIGAYDSAAEYLAPRGRIIMVGMPADGALSRYEPVAFAAAGQGLVGSKMGDVVIQRDIPWMVDLYRQDRLKLDELISRRYTLDQINEAIADTKSGTARRNVIVM